MGTILWRDSQIQPNCRPPSVRPPLFSICSPTSPKPPRSTARLLVIGERGTGKELVAGRLALLSPRWSAPFIKLNCAALPDALLDSELFGHEAGSFTGAQRRRPGRFELADKGTIFLDEIATSLRLGARKTAPRDRIRQFRTRWRR